MICKHISLTIKLILGILLVLVFMRILFTIKNNISSKDIYRICYYTYKDTSNPNETECFSAKKLLSNKRYIREGKNKIIDLDYSYNPIEKIREKIPDLKKELEILFNPNLKDPDKELERIKNTFTYEYRYHKFIKEDDFPQVAFFMVYFTYNDINYQVSFSINNESDNAHWGIIHKKNN
ncbi:hypothetical protein [Conservatibacter flavescens]|uniref:Uncharacterized protein n=1 Tax=Conservatibacter flavescens TaxID=28161 RepID=A0A2M8RZA1_9PAST|nr:hypothetical protein [Conservatibacter flavescens]PJG84208.1 hypothetical protein CVP05_12525 [Conservatibacter flavescens]